jgi:hypothetical protein
MQTRGVNAYGQRFTTDSVRCDQYQVKLAHHDDGSTTFDITLAKGVELARLDLGRNSHLLNVKQLLETSAQPTGKDRPKAAPQPTDPGADLQLHQRKDAPKDDGNDLKLPSPSPTPGQRAPDGAMDFRRWWIKAAARSNKP